MVTEWGMSEALGAINYDGHKRSKFLDIPIGPEHGAYAEDTGRLIDSEVKRIMTNAHEAARTILVAKREVLEIVTRKLLEVEVMEGDQLRQLMGITPPPAAIAAETIPLPTDELR
jgi:cell division protease FtsH